MSIKEELQYWKAKGFNPTILYDAVTDKHFVSLFSAECYTSLMIKKEKI